MSTKPTINAPHAGATCVEIEDVSVHYGDVRAVDKVSLAIEPGDILALVGPSGCGKTSLLKSIAGLQAISSGRISFDGSRLDTQPPHRRNVGMVFQNYALFPHMKIRENVAFGLRMRGERDNVGARVRQALDFLQIGHLAESWPDQLSGGQQQRVALARTLVVEPRVLLLDEPLSALDRQLRDTMRAEIRGMVKEVGITTLIVTHDQEEAMSMADRIAVMRSGRIEQFGTPRELYGEPASEFVAGFIGRVNRFHGVLRALDGDRMRVAVTDGGEINLARPSSAAALQPGADIAVLVRTEALHLGGSEDGVAATVSDRVFLGDRVEIMLRMADDQTVRIEVPDRGRLPEVGEQVRMTFDPQGTFGFPAA